LRESQTGRKSRYTRSSDLDRALHLPSSAAWSAPADGTAASSIEANASEIGSPAVGRFISAPPCAGFEKKSHKGGSKVCANGP
jgi:hypothetical protein